MGVLKQIFITVLCMVVALLIFSFFNSPGSVSMLKKASSKIVYNEIGVKNIASDPNTYLGKQVTIQGVPFPHFEENQPNYIIHSEDEEGKRVSLLLNYPKFHCYKCRITGTILKSGNFYYLNVTSVKKIE